jgi:hypothetical protein
MKQQKAIQQSFDFDILDKFTMTNATVKELRTSFWLPIEKITKTSKIYKDFEANKRKKEIITPWGKTIIKGNIPTQLHRNLFDCILANYDEMTVLDSGDILVKFSTTKILKAYGYSSTRASLWLKEKLDELRICVIEVYSAESERLYDFNIISNLVGDNKKGEFGIIIDKDYANFFANEVTINYKDDLDKLLSVEAKGKDESTALLQAIIRFFWTHQNESHMQIESKNNKIGLLESIGFPIESPKTLQRAKKTIKNNADTLKNFGIIYEEDKKNRLSYLKNSFENSIKFLGSVQKNIKKVKKLETFCNKKILVSDIEYTIENITKHKDSYIIETIEGEKLNIDTTNEITLIETLTEYLIN